MGIVSRLLYPNVAEFWKGSYGDSYTKRFDGEDLVSHREAFFRLVFGKIAPIQSVIEFGANRGLNIRAIKRFASPSITAVEINELAVHELNKIEGANAICGSMMDFAGPQHDLSLSVGVLIHIHPDDLPDAYDTLYTTSRRYILIAEYFNTTPEALKFKGRKDVLWRRDFAGDMLDRYPNLKVLDYGFLWKRDPVMPIHNLTWFLMEKA